MLLVRRTIMHKLFRILTLLLTYYLQDSMLNSFILENNRTTILEHKSNFTKIRRKTIDVGLL